MVTAANNEEDIHPIINELHDHESEIVREYAQTLESFKTDKFKDTGHPESEQKVMATTGVGQEGMTLTIANDRPVWCPALDFQSHMDKARRAYKIKAGSYPAAIHAPPPDEDNLSPFKIFNTAKLSSLGLHLVRGSGHKAKKMSDFGKRPNAQPDDQYFVEQRVLGVNVCALTKISEKQLMLVNRGLSKKLNNDKNDLFVCDYKILKKGAKALNDANSKSYVPAPICVLRYNPHSQTPFTNVAILLDQEHRYGTNVVITSVAKKKSGVFSRKSVQSAGSKKKSRCRGAFFFLPLHLLFFLPAPCFFLPCTPLFFCLHPAFFCLAPALSLGF